MLTEFLPTVEAPSVRDKAIELLRAGGRADLEDAWRLGALLAESGAVASGVEVLRALLDSLAGDGEPSTWRADIAIDLGQMLLMLDDPEGNQILERTAAEAGADVGLDADAIGRFYGWLAEHPSERPPAALDDQAGQLERLVDGWWQGSQRRRDAVQAQDRNATKAGLAARRSLRAWLRNTSGSSRAEYQRLTEEIAALPRKVISNSSRDGGKVKVTLGLAPEFVALQQQLANLRRSEAPGRSEVADRMAAGVGIEYIPIAASPPYGAQFLDGVRGLCDDPLGTEFVIYQGTRGFVQFAAAGLYGLLGEAVANEFLDKDAALSMDEIRRLTGLGWEIPEEGGNFRRIWQEPVDLSAVVGVIVDTFQVYGDALDEVDRVSS